MTLRGWVWLLLVGGLAGCGPSEPILCPVQGKVWCNGQPLTGGVIVFTPDVDRGNRGPLAHGLIRPDGTYTLTTERQAGAVLGWHRVTVATMPLPGTSISVAERYRQPDLSGLVAEVKITRTGSLDFHLDGP
jgi:hypothetical protein